MYKIGFYYHLSHRKKEELVLCLTNEGFLFYRIRGNIVPSRYWDSTNFYRELSNPVLCKIGNDNYVQEIFFLMDFPYCANTEENKGFSFLSDEYLEIIPTLLLDNTPFVNYLSDDKEKKLVQIFTNYVVAKKRIMALSEIVDYIPPYIDEKQKEKVINDFKHRIESYDLDKILSSLSVKVWDSHIHKIGDDDYYYIDRDARLLDASIIIDDYIEKIIGLGQTCIYEDHGYTSSYNMAREAKWLFETYPIGEYSGEMLEKEKQRIRSLYSKEEHMAYLFFDQITNQHNATLLISDWNKVKENAIMELKKEFAIEKISSIEESLFFDFSNYGDHTELLRKINNYMFRLQNLPILKVVISGNMHPLKDEIDMEKLDFYSRSWLQAESNNKKYRQDKYYEAIGDYLESLSQDYFVVLITGGAEGIEILAEKYASEHIIRQIHKREWAVTQEVKNKKRPLFPDIIRKSNGEIVKRSYEMVKMANMIVLFGDEDNYISTNLIKASKKLNKPIKYIKVE